MREIRILVEEDVYEKLRQGKKVPGQMMPCSGEVDGMFSAFNKGGKKCKIHIATTFFGSVYETPTRVKIKESIPKKLGTSKMLQALSTDVKLVMDALVDRDIINHV